MTRAMRIAVAALVMLLAVSPASAQAPRTERLDNGFTIIVRENPLAPVVAISLLVKTGTRWEQPANAGISNFHLMSTLSDEVASGALALSPLSLVSWAVIGADRPIPSNVTISNQ